MGRRKSTAISYEMPRDLQESSVDWLGENHADIIAYLKEKGIATMGEVCDRQSEIPDNFMNRIKAKLIFGIDNY